MSKNEVIKEVDTTRTLCQKLLQEPHYAKMGPEGVFAIVETAQSLGIDPRQGLGGGLYYVKGKVEMSSRMMNALIRSRKHSIRRDPKSNDKICILHGTRADNGDEWTESFSIEEAQKAGLTKSPVWQTYPRDMLFARALSRLARQLFPDVIGNCYVEGEISLDPAISYKESPSFLEDEGTLSVDQVEELTSTIGENEELADKILAGYKVKSFVDIPKSKFTPIMNAINSRKQRGELA